MILFSCLILGYVGRGCLSQEIEPLTALLFFSVRSLSILVFSAMTLDLVYVGASPSPHPQILPFFEEYVVPSLPLPPFSVVHGRLPFSPLFQNLGLYSLFAGAMGASHPTGIWCIPGIVLVAWWADFRPLFHGEPATDERAGRPPWTPFFFFSCSVFP